MAEYQAKHHRPQDDVPVEIMYKYLYKDYLKEQEKRKKVADYARKLERQLKEIKVEKVNSNQLEALRNLDNAHRILKHKYRCMRLYVKYLKRLLDNFGIPHDPLTFEDNDNTSEV